MNESQREGWAESGLVSTGVEGLDEILGGGLPAGQIFLVEGAPGTGKTTLGLQFLIEGARRGEPGLCATLSETEAELRRIARSHGWSMEGVEIHDLTPEEENLEPGEQYTLFHPAEVEFGASLSRLLEAVEETKPARVVIDSMTELRLLAREPLHYRRQILLLRRFLSTRQSTVLFLDDQIDVPDLQLHSLAHGVIRLHHWSGDYGPERRRLLVQKVRGHRFHGGHHDLRIEPGGMRVYPRLASIGSPEVGRPPSTVVNSGIPALDALLGGGVTTGTSVLVTGPAGVGKSSLALQWLAHGAAQGRRGMIYSFDELRSTYLARCEGLGVPVRKLLEADRFDVCQVDPAEMSPGQFAASVREAVEEKGVRSILVDSLNGYVWSMPGEGNPVLHIHELLAWLHARDVLTVLVLNQAGLLEAGTASSMDLSYLSDTVILLRYFEAAGLVRKAVSVVKKRIGGHEASIREFRVGPQGLEVGEPLHEFQGILAGTPTYTGAKAGLLARNGDDG